MHTNDTAEIIRRFNLAFEEHNPALLEDIVGEDCVMETIQPAPDGTRYVGYDVNLAFWRAMAADHATRFEVEDSVVMGDRAHIRWRFHFELECKRFGERPKSGGQSSDARATTPASLVTSRVNLERSCRSCDWTT